MKKEEFNKLMIARRTNWKNGFYIKFKLNKYPIAFINIKIKPIISIINPFNLFFVILSS